MLQSKMTTIPMVQLCNQLKCSICLKYGYHIDRMQVRNCACLTRRFTDNRTCLAFWHFNNSLFCALLTKVLRVRQLIPKRNDKIRNLSYRCSAAAITLFCSCSQPHTGRAASSKTSIVPKVQRRSQLNKKTSWRKKTMRWRKSIREFRRFERLCNKLMMTKYIVWFVALN